MFIAITAAHAGAGPLAGPILENLLVMEVVKVLLGRGQDPRIWFWRTSKGMDVDLLVETEGTKRGLEVVPVEVKRTATPGWKVGDGIRAFREAAGERARPGWVVYLGAELREWGEGTKAVPLGMV